MDDFVGGIPPMGYMHSRHLLRGKEIIAIKSLAAIPANPETVRVSMIRSVIAIVNRIALWLHHQ